MSARVIGIGHDGSGDDAVGLVVARRLRSIGVPREVEIFEVSDAAALLEHLETKRPVIVIDAVVGGGRPGDVVEIAASELAASRHRFVSTHGVDVASAVVLAQLLFANDDMTVVGVAIAPDAVRGQTLSPTVADAVERAAAAVLARLLRCA